MKSLFIAEKPSVAQEFARALKVNGPRRDGYIESEDYVVTWCVGHLVTMSYPEKYDMKYKKWSLDTLPFLPEEFKYEIIPSVSKQFNIVRPRPLSKIKTDDEYGLIRLLMKRYPAASVKQNRSRLTTTSATQPT